MRPFSWRILPLCSLGLLAGAIGFPRLVRHVRADEPVSASSPALDELEVHEVALSELRRSPLEWLGQPVRFTLQLKGPLDAWNPYLTRFGPADWVAFGGWPDELFTWDPEVFEDPLPRLFVRRGSALESSVRSTPLYRRLAVTGVVREVFLDEPWIEVVGLAPQVEFVGNGTLICVSRAFDLMGQGQWDLARQQFQRARLAPVPRHVTEELERLELECASAAEAPRD